MCVCACVCGSMSLFGWFSKDLVIDFCHIIHNNSYSKITAVD